MSWKEHEAMVEDPARRSGWRGFVADGEMAGAARGEINKYKKKRRENNLEMAASAGFTAGAGVCVFTKNNIETLTGGGGG